MNIVATVALVQLCLSATVSVSGNFTETVLTAAPGDVLLPCYTHGNVTPLVTTWTKDGNVVGKKDGASTVSSPTEPRFTVLHNGSLTIREAKFGDGGPYLCNCTQPDNSTFTARVLLQVTNGPNNMSAFIYPVIPLSNGALAVNRGSFVHFHCIASSYPSQNLSWTFSGALSNNTVLSSSSQSSLDYTIQSAQPRDQGLYSCIAVNTVSNRTVNDTKELLVYYVPDTHPDCMWVPTQNLSYIQLNCSWSGMYPLPKLRWGEDGDFQETENLSVMLNSSQVSDGQKVTCTAEHILLHKGKERSCSLTLKRPFPTGEPKLTALAASSVTLTCTEATAVPVASTSWRKGLEQTVIESGSKYLLSVEGPVYKLTILNVSKDDEGCYFCRSENQLGVLELEVLLAVTTSSSAYTGGVLGVLIAALIVGSAIIVAKTLYSRRHQICLGGALRDDDGGDVLSLVDSDDEQTFQDSVPHLPPVANGRHTTLVEIHRIPSCDHEDAETADTKPQPTEETDRTEQSEELVTF